MSTRRIEPRTRRIDLATNTQSGCSRSFVGMLMGQKTAVCARAREAELPVQWRDDNWSGAIDDVSVSGRTTRADVEWFNCRRRWPQPPAVKTDLNS